MTERTDEVWKAPSLTAAYLEGVRAAIPLAQQQIDVMLRLIAARGQPVQSFLDIGCGDGVLSAAIIQRFPQAHGVLIDFSKPMLDAAIKRFANQNASLHLANVDYGRRGWTQVVDHLGPYDAIVSGYSIHHQPDTRKREIYGEIFRLLRPGGIFINVEHVSSASQWIAAVNDDLFIDHLHGGRKDMSRSEVAETYYHRPDKAANILAPVELQCQWLRDTGFADVDCYLKVFELAVFGGRRPS
jgi:tRNA (cmo5U34)-methyltransferase